MVGEDPLCESTLSLQVVSDRGFNSRSAFNARALAYSGYAPIDYVEYDEGNPDRLTMVYGTVGPDMRPLPKRKIELFVNGRRSETGFVEGRRAFWAAELYRQVLVGPRRVEATGG